MSLILNALITIIAVAATSVLLPTIPLSHLRLVLRGVGWFIQKRTRSRREFIISRVRADEEEFQAKQGSPASGKSSSTSQTEDEDWEKVDTSLAVGNNNGNGHREKNGQRKAQGQGSKDQDWDGIIGFFHPFWYALVATLQPGFALTPMVKQQRRWRGRTCSLGGVESNAEKMAQGYLCCVHR